MTIIHDSKGVVSEQELVKLENLLGINLPKDYRGFLKKHNGGYPEPDGFDFASGDDGSSVDKFFGISDSKTESIFEYYSTYKDRIPGNYFPVAKDPGGSLILVEIGRDTSSVYFWDHESEAEDGDIPGMDNVHLISPSFDEFIDNLYEIEI
ncbi:SMI1/KNR4 family protein [Erwinia amylovora]|uniref:SMI1/KNR4 family protein n=1 Tax=Erwinia amylovora TaxID=552 RepID=UPI000C06805D|nr:SMI1/KNR4 family protein [Erwinia amylovora]MBZ2401119.1 SMI1/KNR4 family protein [Erwinia amylovora]MBZ2404536.1 SMI1/KNR4 family protein [Erwinia amylovora]